MSAGVAKQNVLELTPSFEQLRVGYSLRVVHRVTADDLEGFAGVSGDTNPLHMDAEFAKLYGFRGRVVHGMFLGAVLSRVIGMRLPGPGALWLSQDLHFLRPVYVGDVLDFAVLLKQKSEAHRVVVLEVKVTNGSGDAVLSGESRVMMLESGANVPWTEMVAVVTGGSRGIGAGVAQHLAAKGATVVVNYVQARDRAEEIVAAIQAANGNAFAVQADVMSDDGVDRLVDATIDQYGRVDVIVNNASPFIALKPATDVTSGDLDTYLRAYVHGPLRLVQRALPGMIERNFGRIVNVLTTSILGVPPTGSLAYVAAKSALWGTTKSLALELAPYGITVNAVSPSAVLTGQWDDVPEARRRALAMRSPRKRVATAGDVAKAVAFLIGEAGDYLTGVNLPIAGGETMN